MSAMTWLNEPPVWSTDDRRVTLTTGHETDFWRTTYYDFVHDDGHFYSCKVAGDFTATVEVSAHYEALYDQAGLMVRVDDEHWIKAGVEFSDGVQNVSVVVTRGHSDWSMIPVGSGEVSRAFRLSRQGSSLRVEYQTGPESWQMIRLAYLPMPTEVEVGLMACSPTRSGFAVEFRYFEVGELVSTEIH